MRVSAAEGVGSGAQEALERLLPTHLMVLPKPRREREVELPMEGLTVTKAIVLPNLPFKKAGVKGCRIQLYFNELFCLLPHY